VPTAPAWPHIDLPIAVRSRGVDLPSVVAVAIPGAKSPEQAAMNAAAGDRLLAAAVIDRLRAQL
jgi:hypothetical protein